MPLPLRTRAFWTVYKLLERRPAMQQPAERTRAAADRRKRSLGLPGSALIVGRTDPGVTTEDMSFTTPDGVELPVRVYRPKNGGDDPLPVIVNFHGGGWVSGDIEQSQWWCSSLSARAGVVIVSVEYRLAPENPFPAAPEDCYATVVWTAEHAAELNVDPTRLAVMGDSAGGNLAAVVCLMTRDRSGPPIALQILLYPSVRLEAGYPSEIENANAPVLGKADLDNVPLVYFHGSDRSQADPYASPINADSHEGLPPAMIQTAEFDPLRDHGAFYADTLRKAGVEVRLTNYLGAVHGYISLPGVVPAARQALGETADEVLSRLC